MKQPDKSNVCLQKELKPLHVWALAFGCIIGGSAFFMPGATFLPKAGPLGTAIAIFTAAVLMIVIAFNYHYMVNKFPVAGGEFAFAQNAFGEKHAFLCAWFLGLSYISLVPLNATLLGVVGRNLFAGFFTAEPLYEIAGFGVYLFDILLAVASIVGLSVLNIRGIKVTGSFNTLLAFALVLGVGVFALVAIFGQRASTSVMSPAFPSGEGAALGLVGIFAVSPWAFVGFDTVPQTAEEFAFSHSKTRLLLVFAILFSALVYVTINTVTTSVVPVGFSSWEGYIAQLKTFKGLESMPTFYAAHELMGNCGLALFCVAIIATCFASVVGFSVASSRLLYSMSRAKALPGWFGELHPSFATPRNAIVFVMLLSLLAPFFGRTVLLWIVDMSAIGAAVGYGYTSLATVKYARREGDTCHVIMGSIGTVASCGFIVLLLVPIKAFACSLHIEEYVALILWMLLGLLFYARRVSRNGAV